MTITRLDGNGKPIAKGSKTPVARYQVRWRDGSGAQRAKSFARAVDAATWEKQVGADELAGVTIDANAGRQTVEQFAREWAAGQPWRASSRARMMLVIDKRIVPRFGAMQVRAVQPSHVQAWVGSMASSGLASSTVESYYLVLASVMKAAVLNEAIRKTPCRQIALPREERNAAALVPLTSAQVRALSQAVPERYRALVLVSAGLGLRQGEACGLSVDRVDFLRRHVTIDRQIITPDVGPVTFGPPKTKSSNRTITLPSSVGDVLAAHIAKFGTGPDGLLFTSRTGAVLRRSTWSAAFDRAARDVGVNASSHDLRHHCASLLIASGCSVKAVQQYLGHKNASETLDTYGHLWPGDEDRIRAAIDAGFSQDVHEVCTEGEQGSG
jgi:integrase